MLTDHDSTLERLAIPDAILPAQYQSRRRGRLDGVLRLMFAVLMDAVRCWQRGAPADSPSKMRIYLEAGEWIFATRGDSPFLLRGDLGRPWYRRRSASARFASVARLRPDQRAKNRCRR